MPTIAESKPAAIEVAPGLPTPPRAADAGAWSRYYEEVYRHARGDRSRVRWADARANPGLISWLTVEAPCLVRPGATAVVVGAGLGEDARELADRGYDVTAFDVSPSAIDWAKRAHPEIAERFSVADLLNLPPTMLRRADLVVEISTIQSLHPDLRQRAADAVISLARPRGVVLVICRGREESDPCDGPPFPLTKPELTTLFSCRGWMATREIDDYEDDEQPPVRRMRAAFRRA